MGTGCLPAQVGRSTGNGHTKWASSQAYTSATRPYRLSLIAEICGYVGRPEEGMQIITEALEQVERSGERRWEAELHRLKGELLLAQSSDNHASRKAASTKPSL